MYLNKYTDADHKFATEPIEGRKYLQEAYILLSTLMQTIVEHLLLFSRMITIMFRSSLYLLILCASVVNRDATLDWGPVGPWFKSEWVPIFYEARSTPHGSPKPPSVWGSLYKHCTGYQSYPTSKQRLLGCESNIDNCNFQLCLLERLCIYLINNLTEFKDGLDTCIKLDYLAIN